MFVSEFLDVGWAGEETVRNSFVTFTSNQDWFVCELWNSETWEKFYKYPFPKFMRSSITNYSNAVLNSLVISFITKDMTESNKKLY